VKPKPELTLTPVDLMNDLDALIAFYTKLTGQTPTQAEIDELRAEMAQDAAERRRECED